MTAGLPKMIPSVLTILRFRPSGSLPEGFAALSFFDFHLFPRFILLPLVIFFLPIGSSPAFADSLARQGVSGVSEAVAFPEELGEIVYRRNPGRPVQLFIIGNSHRSPLNGENGDRTIAAQLQTYRIGEWLIENQQVELLLPEGFFGMKAGTGRRTLTARRLDESLGKALADTSTFINADLLLHADYGIPLHQIEDREIYAAVRDCLLVALQGSDRRSGRAASELVSLQERRSALMLERVPAIIDAEYARGHIALPRALLTIGLEHLDEIITFFATGGMEMKSVHSGWPALSASLASLRHEIGVTVIVPRAVLALRGVGALARADY